MNARSTNIKKPLVPKRSALKKSKRIIVKVGTSLLTGGGTSVNQKYLKRFAGAIGKLWSAGYQTAIVSSGAIGAGSGALDLQKPPRSLPDRQACAAIGQVELMKFYSQAFRRQNPSRNVGQLLLTRDGLEDRKRYLNARHTLEALFDRNVVPIINENDTVSVDELRFGDNDTLSALLAVLCEAELLILLTDVPGLMDAVPTQNSDANLISIVENITPEIELLAKPSGSFLGTGGMVSKLEAAKIVTGAGEHMVLVDGHNPEILEDILAGENVGTYFPPKGDRLTARKRWLAYSTRPHGTIHVDAGAQEALIKRHKSLLPSGVTRVSGSFKYGGLISIAGPGGHEFARGLSNYNDEEVQQLRGKKTAQIAQVMGQLLFKEVVHRDNLVMLGDSTPIPQVRKGKKRKSSGK